MEDGKATSGATDWLLEKSQIRERPFTSTIPLIGRFIAWFRSAWNSVSTKWYMRPIIAQQNELNRTIIQQLQENDESLMAQDREQTALIRQSAALSAQLVQMNQHLAAIEARLARLESAKKDSD